MLEGAHVWTYTHKRTGTIHIEWKGHPDGRLCCGASKMPLGPRVSRPVAELYHDPAVCRRVCAQCRRIWLSVTRQWCWPEEKRRSRYAGWRLV